MRGEARPRPALGVPATAASPRAPPLLFCLCGHSIVLNLRPHWTRSHQTGPGLCPASGEHFCSLNRTPVCKGNEGPCCVRVDPPGPFRGRCREKVDLSSGPWAWKEPRGLRASARVPPADRRREDPRGAGDLVSGVASLQLSALSGLLRGREARARGVLTLCTEASHQDEGSALPGSLGFHVRSLGPAAPRS